MATRAGGKKKRQALTRSSTSTETAILGTSVLAAISVACLSLVAGLSMAAAALQIASTTTVVYKPDLVIQEVTKDPDGALRLWIKNDGNNWVGAPTKASDGVCYFALGTNPADSTLTQSFGCVDRNIYPIGPGQVVSDRMTNAFTGTIRVGLDGVYFDQPSQTFRLDAAFNKISETDATRELNNNSKVVDASVIRNSNQVLVSVPIASQHAAGGTCAAYHRLGVNSSNSCCLQKYPAGSGKICSGFYGQDPFERKATDFSNQTLWCSAKQMTAGQKDSFTLTLANTEQIAGLKFTSPRGTPYACTYPTSYDIQVFTNGQWVNALPTVTGNTASDRTHLFDQVQTTNQVRIVVHTLWDPSGWHLSFNEIEALKYFQPPISEASGTAVQPAKMTIGEITSKSTGPAPTAWTDASEHCQNECTQACINLEGEPTEECLNACTSQCMNNTCYAIIKKTCTLMQAPLTGTINAWYENLHEEDAPGFCGAAKRIYQSIDVRINYRIPIPGDDNDYRGTYVFNVVGTCAKIAEGAIIPLPAKIVLKGVSYLTGVVESWSYGEYGGVYISQDGTNPKPDDAPKGTEN